ncbi:MAG: hypothetical protein LC799_29505 [Actinobacteria bacterium]|nr:hypothetical protein [Actinomycetota bacterium]
MLQRRESLPHPAKENPFGVVIYLKFANEPSLSTAKLLHGAAERTHLLLTLPLGLAVEGPEVVVEKVSSLGTEYALPEESDDALKETVLSHPYGRWVVGELTFRV